MLDLHVLVERAFASVGLCAPFHIAVIVSLDLSRKSPVSSLPRIVVIVGLASSAIRSRSGVMMMFMDWLSLHLVTHGLLLVEGSVRDESDVHLPQFISDLQVLSEHLLNLLLKNKVANGEMREESLVMLRLVQRREMTEVKLLTMDTLLQAPILLRRAGEWSF